MRFTVKHKQEIGGVITHLQVRVNYFMLNEVDVLNPKIYISNVCIRSSST